MEKDGKRHHGPIGAHIRKVARGLPDEGIALAELLKLLGQDSLMVVVCFLALVFLVPVSVPGVSSVFGLVIVLIGANRLLGRELWLPRGVRCTMVPVDKLRHALAGAQRWLERLERVTRPQRLPRLAGESLAWFNNAALILGGLLLMAPFGFIPFSNTLPALAVIFIALGFLQRDGLCVLLGHGANLASVLYFAVLIAGGGVVLHEGMQRLWH